MPSILVGTLVAWWFTDGRALTVVTLVVFALLGAYGWWHVSTTEEDHRIQVSVYMNRLKPFLDRPPKGWRWGHGNAMLFVLRRSADRFAVQEVKLRGKGERFYLAADTAVCVVHEGDTIYAVEFERHQTKRWFDATGSMAEIADIY